MIVVLEDSGNRSGRFLTLKYSGAIFVGACQVVKIQSIMFYYVYVLQSVKTGKLYVGLTIDLIKRLREHNRGLNFSTKPFIPWKVIHYMAYLDKEDAMRREKYLKTNQGARLLKRMLKEYFYHQLHKSKNY